MPYALQGKMLDLGCGSRPYFDLYRNLFGHCVAADYERRGPLSIQLDATTLPFRDACFDVVLMTEVIEHIPEANNAFSEITRVLKPGGLLLITWPFNYLMHEIPSDYNRFTEFGMKHRIAKFGMQIEMLLRRGNAIVLGIVLFEFFLCGIIKSFSRLSFVGKWVEKLTQGCVAYLFTLIYKLYISWAWRGMHVKPMRFGAGFNGIVGHMSLWNLGYCARVRKLGALH